MRRGKKLFILDGNNIVFRAFYAMPADLRSGADEPTGATYGFCRQLFKLLRERNGDTIAVAWDCPRSQSWRRSIFAAYKANRDGGRKVEGVYEQIKRCRELCRLLGITSIRRPTVEADDIIAAMTHRFVGDYQVRIISNDKDMLQLVGRHVSVLDLATMDQVHATDVEERYGIRPKRFADYLALVGDSSDNIPGVPGIGPVKAVELLKRYPTIKAMYRDRYNAGLSPRVIDAMTRPHLQLMMKLTRLRTDAPLGKINIHSKPRFKRATPLLRELGFKRYVR